MTPAARGARGAPGFLDPATLARIDNLELLARTVVDGFISGLHRSPYLGLSLDFAEHRPYNPGDDIRRIDWKLFGRTDRYYVKEFEADTNANFTVLLDTSASMDYGTGALTKLDYARYLAACLTYFSRQQRDRVGLVTFDRQPVDFVPPSARHLDIVLHTLDRVVPGHRREEPATPDTSPANGRRGVGTSDTRTGGSPVADGAAGLAAAVGRVAERLRRRGIVVLISDLYEEPDRIVESVRQLRYRGSDVIVFHVLDPAEIELPFDVPVQVQELESGERMAVVPEAVRDRYRERVAAHVRALDRGLAEERVDYALLDTATPLDYALFRYLSDRERLSRVR